MKKRNLVETFTFIITAVVLVALAGCKTAQPPKQQMVGVGTRFSTSSPPLKEEDPGTKLSYNLEPNKPFEGTYEIENVRDEKYTYLLLAFLDFKQISFALNGVTSLQHKITLKPYEKKWQKFRTSPLKKGFHNYSMILIWDPYNHSLNKNFRLATDFSFIASNRANLVVGGKYKPKTTFTKPDACVKQIDLPQNSRIPITDPMRQNDYDGVRINKKKNSLETWVEEETKAGKKVKYYIHLANNTNKTKEFALLVLLDYKQIPVRSKGPLVIYTKVKPKEIQTFSANFKAPNKKGVHELLVIRAVNPLGEIKKEEDALIEPSIRVPIVVK